MLNPTTPDRCKADPGTRRGAWLSCAPGSPAHSLGRDPESLQAPEGQPVRDTQEQLAACGMMAAAKHWLDVKENQAGGGLCMGRACSKECGTPRREPACAPQNRSKAPREAALQ